MRGAMVFVYFHNYKFNEVSIDETTGLPKPCMAGSPFLVSLTSDVKTIVSHNYLLRC